jgi:alpha-galactosidase/6-phospho-beta-glucosidase family protein
MTQKTSKRKITFIGAGSTVFAKNLLVDILSYKELADSEICLFDIDVERLRTSEVVARRVAQQLSAAPRIGITTDPANAFDGASYAINMIQVGGYRPCTVTDFEINTTRSSPNDFALAANLPSAVIAKLEPSNTNWSFPPTMCT